MSEIHLPKIAVVGVGGAGINMVKHMQELGLQGIDFVVANTDAQSLAHVEATKKIHLGKELTQGFGAGGDPVIGEKAAQESLNEIIEAISPYQMIFITAGMGGGTGSGAAAVVGRAAKDQGILSVGLITRPFEFEGRKRTAIADEAIAKFKQSVDSFVVLQNEKLFDLFDDEVTQMDAFHKADALITNSLKGLTDILSSHGQINLDFADLRAILKEAGQIVLNSAVAEGDERAQNVSQGVLNNPLLDNGSIKGANQVLIQISGGPDVKLKEVKHITDAIREHLPHFGNLIFGTHFKEDLKGTIHISLIASGLGENAETIDKAPAKKTLGSFMFSKPIEKKETAPMEPKPTPKPEPAPQPVEEAPVMPEMPFEPETGEVLEEDQGLSADFDDLKKLFAFETQTEEPKTEEAAPAEAPVQEEIKTEDAAPEEIFLTEELIIEEAPVEQPESTPESRQEVAPQPKPEAPKKEPKMPDNNGDLLKMLGEIDQNKSMPEELEIPSFLRDLKPE